MDIDLSKESRPITRKRALALARHSLKEFGDYPPGFAYSIGMMTEDSDGLLEEMAELREANYKALGKKPPEQEPFR